MPVDLGRIWKSRNRVDDENAALLAASRGGEPRAAEMARELMPEWDGPITSRTTMAKACDGLTLPGSRTDPKVASEASNDWKNLRTSQKRFRTTGRIFPVYSTRWHYLFSYGQFTTAWRVRFPIHFTHM